ncbi:hypothetical protein LOTGIDRAFT_172760 [Lottia gigantea]|uniref:Uncharacterized protein n=1 Tax=Lottia gigantea TaxID=225164 RepID=V4B1E7_LOTGI|nr:hypothetical protein LOTGIDRAFT_172760 [Lottia gigantea]ESP01131.1 hypothetical protein LOTGIDRAFT_172760 [Lottia gigantea]
MWCFLYFLLTGLVDVLMAKPLELSGALPSTLVLPVMLPVIASLVVTIFFMSLCVTCKKKSATVSPQVKQDRNVRRTSIRTYSIQSEDLTPVNTTYLNTDTKSKTITRKISQTERVRVKQPATIFE